MAKVLRCSSLPGSPTGTRMDAGSYRVHVQGVTKMRIWRGSRRYLNTRQVTPEMCASDRFRRLVLP